MSQYWQNTGKFQIWKLATKLPTKIPTDFVLLVITDGLPPKYTTIFPTNLDKLDFKFTDRYYPSIKGKYNTPSVH